MKEKLEELLDKAFLECEDNYGRPNTEQVAEYLIKNGIIAPPMKLGQICFEPCSYRNSLSECKVSSITQKADGTFKIRLTNISRGKFVFEITASDIGKEIFLTKEDAEKALAKRGE